MNSYVEDGVYWLSRASAALGRGADRDRANDSILFFAFGVEKLVKGVLCDVNPLFIYSDPKIENVAGILYAARMTVGQLNHFKAKDKQKKINRDVHSGGTSLSNAQHFSQVVCDHSSKLYQLFGYRGTIAHKAPEDLDVEAAIRFVSKFFHPIVEDFIAELKLDPARIYVRGNRELLEELSQEIQDEDNFKKRMEDLAAEHIKLWDKFKNDSNHLTKAAADTKEELDRERPHEPFTALGKCPLCSQKAVIFFEPDVEYMDGEAVTTGAFATGLTCFYCQLMFEGSEESDYFRLNSQMWE